MYKNGRVTFAGASNFWGCCIKEKIFKMQQPYGISKAYVSSFSPLARSEFLWNSKKQKEELFLTPGCFDRNSDLSDFQRRSMRDSVP